MARGAAFVLGAALMLDGATAARAADLYLPDATSVLAGVLPSVPQNWSDLPMQLKLSEKAGYNSNILNTPVGATALYGQPVGSLVSISDIGAATKVNWEGQQFYADGSIGLYRYLADPSLNTLSNSLDLGDNWTYGSRCSGKLFVSEQTSPSEPGQQVGFNVKNSTTSITFNELGNCRVSGDYGLQLNSGVTSTTNSAAIDKFNDSQNVFIAAGITYSVAETNSLAFLATVTGINYTDRAATLNSQGLFSNVVENQLNLTYTKNFSPNLDLTASAGVVGTRQGSFSLEPAKGFEPIYSATVTWRATPKLALTAAAAHSVSPPTSIIANLQVSDNANFNLSYNVTPKVMFAAGVSASRASGAATSSINPSITNPALLPFTQSSSTYSANASINYTITPFIAANLSYTHTRSLQANLVTPTDVILLALTFNPY